MSWGRVTLFVLFLLTLIFVLDMSKGFATENAVSNKKNFSNSSNVPMGRLISWSPWPPADFQIRYPAFPFVLTILIIVIGQWYLSLLR